MKKPEDNPDMRVLKTATCKTISAKSTLTYHVGADTDDEIYLRIHASTGNGIFSGEWISTKDIQAVMEVHPAGTPVTSFLLQPLFHGKSANNSAFLLAILLASKLAYPVKGKKRQLAVVDSDEFTEKVSKLASSKSTTNKTTASSKKKTVSRKAIIKKKAMARRKTTQ